METASLLVELLATLIENIVALAAVSTASGKRCNGAKHIFMLVLLALLNSFLVTVMNRIEVFSYATSIAAVALVVLAAKFISTGSFLTRCISGILTFVVIYSVDYIVVALMGIISGNAESFFTIFVTTPGIPRILFLAIDKLSDVLLYILLRRKLLGFHTISKRLQHPLLALSMISFVAMQVLFQVILVPNLPIMQLTVIFSWTFVVGFVTMITAFFLSLTKIEHNKQTEEMLRSENTLMTENYTQLHEYQQNCAKDIHDFRHHLMTVKGLALEGHSGKIPSYIDSLLAVSYQYSSRCHSGSDIIDAIINCKSSEAQELGIDFHFTVNIQAPLYIDPVDLCGILANQLDNALDACREMPDSKERKISVEVMRINDFVFLKVENTVNCDPFLNNRDLKSTKADQSSPHGLGLINIRSIAKKYEGTVRHEFKNGTFISSVSLCQRPLDT